MTSNPFDRRRSEPEYSPISLEAYCEQLNAMAFSQENGWRWRIATRKIPGGQVEKFLDRWGDNPPPLKMTERECEIVHEVIGELRAKGYPDEEISAMIRKGITQREVSARLQDEQHRAA
jgi:hypothetical protein